MTDTIKINSAIPMIAHRGVSGLERENTNAAFVAAGNRSYFGIETDIHCTKDHRMIVIHDNRTDRIAEISLPVEETEFDVLRELRLCDLDGNLREDLCLPCLEEYIRICRKYEKKSILEIKNHFAQADIDAAVEIIRTEGWLDNTIFISFDLPNLIYLRSLLPEQQMQYLTETIDASALDAAKKYRLDIDVYYAEVSQEQISGVHTIGQKVNVWTVNDPSIAQHLIQMGVDYITTNILE